MIRNTVVVLALLAPTAARAEFKAKKSVDIRPTSSVMKVEAKVVEEPLTVDAVLGKINSTYMAGLQRCYVRGLRHDSTLRGKVTVLFTVGADGRVTGNAAGIAPSVDRCVTNKLSMWRFAAPRDKKNKATEQSFKISLMLFGQ